MPPLLLSKNRLEYEDHLRRYRDNTNFANSAYEIGDYIQTFIRHQKTPILVLDAGTGTGKSTTLPIMLYDNNRILLAEPTISTTISIAMDIKTFGENRFTFGDNLGYITGDAKLRNQNTKTFVRVCTHGVLNAQLDDIESFGKMYDIVLFDEVHRESGDTIRMFELLKKGLELPVFPVIVLMSGTLEINTLVKYFEVDERHVVRVKKEPSYPITTYYNDKMLGITDIIKSILSNKYTTEEDKKSGTSIDSQLNNNHILIFCHSAAAINKYKKIINREFNDNNEFLLIEVSSATMSLKGEDYLNLFREIDPKEGIKLKIIFGTNSIETGATIPGLKYCIDTALAKEGIWCALYDIKALVDSPIPKSSVIQRRGRVGRLTPGVFIPLYTEKLYNKLPDFPFPKMVTTESHSFVLEHFYREDTGDGIKNVVKTLFEKKYMVNVPLVSTVTSIRYLLHCGALIGDGDGLKITEAGKYALKMRRLEPRIGCFVYYALKYTCIDANEIITIATMINDSRNIAKLIGNRSFIDSDPIIKNGYIERKKEAKNTLLDLMIGYETAKEKLLYVRLGIISEKDFTDIFKISPKNISDFIVGESFIRDSIMSSNILHQFVSPLRIKLRNSINLFNKQYFEMLNGLIKIIFKSDEYHFNKTTSLWFNRHKNIKGSISAGNEHSTSSKYLLDSLSKFNIKVNKFTISANVVVDS
jgi:HrpA-like RNA helicase